MQKDIYQSVMESTKKFELLEYEFEVKAKKGTKLVQEVAAAVLIRRAYADRLRAHADFIEQEAQMESDGTIRIIGDLVDAAKITHK
jgi:hypothetical protein